MTTRVRENWIALSTLVVKEFHRITRIWIQTLLPPAITMSLYFVIFGSLIGKRIGQMGGFSYMEYIAPGHGREVVPASELRELVEGIPVLNPTIE